MNGVLEASVIAWGEVVGALGIRVRRENVDSAEAKSLFDEFSDDVGSWSRIGATSADMTAATEFVSDFTLSLRFVDAIHVAVAARCGATLITTDR